MINPTKKFESLKTILITESLNVFYFGKANAIVTGDKEMLKLRKYKGIKIISLKEYLG
ncbi:MAG: hypothetical protein L6Q53_10765 [Candidatus Brocadia sinica]|uniref:hypothetical protein n=1 Tax=Candidatus Brocadia sp. AMX2 TaxID=2293635 RepID=UPI001811BCD2|nr:hypothetical protein [Candidatus Brocadia sp. AMX2]MCK6468659.1 hypothetical protein [Candidatus Brocadia sinica]NOG42456.1 hypothetical protein [Planctomycetota bacterium]GIK11677.1 MAG: hypothetical protein BroJett002_03840 [Candidatus Brocadia sinica]GJQ19211.1 MAG: hypothetical protein HBSIN01_31700 [Candidatus Brocadia sinica]